MPALPTGRMARMGRHVEGAGNCKAGGAADCFIRVWQGCLQRLAQKRQKRRGFPHGAKSIHDALFMSSLQGSLELAHSPRSLPEYPRLPN